MLQQPVSSPAQRVGDATRRGELDLLRALVVVGLVFFHFADCGTFTPSFVGPSWGTWQDFPPSGGEVIGD
jgi:peptidoglycan/LPS O-acetylase OafA/YrhL